MRQKLYSLLVLLCTSGLTAQNDKSLPPESMERMKQRLMELRTTELVMSMSQRSLVMPDYLQEL